jgi:Xaa-Pro aminopeptidase
MDVIYDAGDREATALLDAQRKARQLFEEIASGLLRPGVSESQLSEEIHALAHRRFGVETHWHKRIVRAGPNTLLTFAEESADRTLGADDVVFLDLGPDFEAWEADFGFTYVLGDDPDKHRLRDALEPTFRAVKGHFEAHPDITGEQLYEAAHRFAAEAGCAFGGTIAGHVVGAFPHERIPDDRVTLYITRGNHRPIRSLGASGRPRHWILEIHLVDRARGIGAFFEDLLTV